MAGTGKDPSPVVRQGHRSLEDQMTYQSSALVGGLGSFGQRNRPSSTSALATSLHSWIPASGFTSEAAIASRSITEELTMRQLGIKGSTSYAAQLNSTELLAEVVSRPVIVPNPSTSFLLTERPSHPILHRSH